MAGDLNIAQEYCLHWLMLDEAEEKRALEENRTKAVILAGNPQLYMKLWPEVREEEIDWETPQTEEELADLIKEFETGFSFDPALQQPHP